MQFKAKIFVMGCFVALASSEASAEAAHWSVFNKQATLCACHLFARSAFESNGFKVLEDDNAVLVGQQGNVIATAMCLPGNAQSFVFAASDDSGAAERARNNLRSSIVNAALFDTCP